MLMSMMESGKALDEVNHACSNSGMISRFEMTTMLRLLREIWDVIRTVYRRCHCRCFRWKKCCPSRRAVYRRTKEISRRSGCVYETLWMEDQMDMIECEVEVRRRRRRGNAGNAGGVRPRLCESRRASTQKAAVGRRHTTSSVDGSDGMVPTARMARVVWMARIRQLQRH